MKDLMFNRRHALLGAAAVAGGGLLLGAKTAQAFPFGARLDFARVSRILDPYGVDVSGVEGPPHDVLSFEVKPRSDIEYVHAVKRPGANVLENKSASYRDGASFVHHQVARGGAVPVVRTAVQRDVGATHELFDDGALIPCIKVTSELRAGGHVGTVEFLHLHPGEDGEYIPCARTTIHDHELVTTAIIDAGFDAARPSMDLAAEMREGGFIGEVVLRVFDRNARLTVQIGELTYQLVDGELVLLPR